MMDFMAPDMGSLGGMALGPGARSNMRTDDIAGAQPKRKGFQRSEKTEQMLGMGGMMPGPGPKMYRRVE